MTLELFGTDGIRAPTNSSLWEEAGLEAIASAVVVRAHLEGVRGFVIGRDTRPSGSAIVEILTEYIARAGFDVCDVGVLPTAGVSHGCRLWQHMGIVVSASHNPPSYNGIKFFDMQGRKWSPAWEKSAEKYIRGEDEDGLSPSTTLPPLGRYIDERATFWRRYAAHLAGMLPSLGGYSVALDCAYGASYRVAPCVFEQLNAATLVRHGQADGSRINVDSGVLCPEKLVHWVRQVEADVGFAFDGDADRVVMVDDEGHIFDGDRILFLLAIHAKPKPKTVVGTVMSGKGLEEMFQEERVKLLRSDVGDRNVLTHMEKKKLRFGGERSGHIIDRNYLPVGDGIYVATQMARLLTENPSLFKDVNEKYPHYEGAWATLPIDKWSKSMRAKTVQEVEQAKKDEVYLVVRPSGTEPLIRIWAESKSTTKAKAWVKRLQKELEQ